MVLDTDFRPLHGLTDQGKREYEDFLEKKADDILFKHQHPLKWICSEVKQWLSKE